VPPVTDQPGALDGLRILVVDDDPESLELVAELLEMNGAEVQRARGVTQAREVLLRFRADLVISDLSMPEGDGFDLIMEIRRLPAEAGGDTPAIAFSGSSDPLSRARALAYGFQEYVPKPVDSFLLVNTVAALARRATR